MNGIVNGQCAGILAWLECRLCRDHFFRQAKPLLKRLGFDETHLWTHIRETGSGSGTGFQSASCSGMVRPCLQVAEFGEG